MNMKRANVYFSEWQVKAISFLSRRTGLKPAEIMRRALDIGLKQILKEESDNDI